jgi:hypothetical protein
VINVEKVKIILCGSISSIIYDINSTDIAPFRLHTSADENQAIVENYLTHNLAICGFGGAKFCGK